MIIYLLSFVSHHAGCDGDLYFVTTPSKDFNPRIPCRVHKEQIEKEGDVLGISIHAPHAGCDFLGVCGLYG